MGAVNARLAIVVAAAVASLNCNPHPPAIDIATTTSVANSGLLDTLLPEFHESTVRVHAAGSGRALAMLADRTVALVISHAPAAEQVFLEQHPTGWQYRKLAYNQFVIVGPPADPAAVRTAGSATEAFARIARSRSAFVSRGDSSGTHEREAQLWQLAGAAPATGRLLVSGGSMAVTLMQADSQLAYTLTDDATWHQLRGRRDGLVQVFANDPALLNTYAVIHHGGDSAAAALAGWLTAGRGRELIGNYLIDDRPAFHLWPAGCAGSTPAALVCAK